jgi:hypothetical protein
MLTSDKWPYVMDFGLAKALQTESNLSVSGAVMGTPAYMPPEQAQGHLDQIDAQSDVYSLGATMYAVICKKQPFAGQSPMEVLMKVCKDEPPKPRSLIPDLPEPVERMVLKAMSKEKADRYATAGALADDIKRFLTDGDVGAQGPSSIRSAARRAKGNPWPLVAGAAVLILLVVGGIMMFRPPTPQPAPTQPPVVVNPVPPPAPPQAPVADPEEAKRKEKEAREQKWIGEWLGIRQKLNFDFWTAGDAALGPKTVELLGKLESDASIRDSADESEWVLTQAQSVLQHANSLGKDRDQALKVVGWCDVMGPALKGSPKLASAVGMVEQARAAAAKVASFKGSVTLKLFVGPFAEVLKVTRDGAPLTLSAKSTPLVIPNVEIGDFEVELSHPQHGKKTEKIPAATLKDGKTYVLSGQLKDALRLTEAP